MATKKKRTSAAKSEEPQVEEQAQTDVVAEQGYVGVVPDQTPNENYTVKGVLANKPVPETDRKLAEQNRLEAAKRRGEAA